MKGVNKYYKIGISCSRGLHRMPCISGGFLCECGAGIAFGNHVRLSSRVVLDEEAQGLGLGLGLGLGY